MSFGARLLLGLVAGLFGAVMFLAAPPGTDSKAIGFYAFGVFCLLIAIACFTSGRVRQFIGSVIGCSIFLVGVTYLVAELSSGKLLGSTNPSAYNAAKYLLFIGMPGIVYAYKVRFGFRKSP
ncbi:hypothetical protein [Dokdonella soli]|uniref:hypothetical protein n=1 Tax=Dokdonella soli TaxID=529810 RepID=UPI0031DB17EB